MLNLYAGIGGNRKLWEEVDVTAVEYNDSIAKVYQELFPNDVVVIGCAFDYLVEHYKDYDFIWASPPCQSHSRIRFAASKRGSYKPIPPDLTLYSLVLFLQKFYDGKWVIENVIPYYKPLIEPSAKIGRHLFWSNFDIGNFYVEEVRHNDINKRCDDWGLSLKDKKINVRKDQVIRNCVYPEVGKHILDEVLLARQSK